MLISEYLQLRGAAAAEKQQEASVQKESQASASQNPAESPFAAELKNLMAANGCAGVSEIPARTTAEQLEIMSGINFSRHAVDRINQRQIDIFSSDKLARLSKGVELAESKGSDDALVIVDKTAFVVSVRSNKVITAVNADDMQGNVFTNIDSTVIM